MEILVMNKNIKAQIDGFYADGKSQINVIIGIPQQKFGLNTDVLLDEAFLSIGNQLNSLQIQDIDPSEFIYPFIDDGNGNYIPNPDYPNTI